MISTEGCHYCVPPSNLGSESSLGDSSRRDLSPVGGFAAMALRGLLDPQCSDGFMLKNDNLYLRCHLEMKQGGTNLPQIMSKEKIIKIIRCSLRKKMYLNRNPSSVGFS